MVCTNSLKGLTCVLQQSVDVDSVKAVKANSSPASEEKPLKITTWAKLRLSNSHFQTASHHAEGGNNGPGDRNTPVQ